MYTNFAREFFDFQTLFKSLLNKKLHLLNVNPDCMILLDKASNIVEIQVVKYAEYHIADDALDT